MWTFSFLLGIYKMILQWMIHSWGASLRVRTKEYKSSFILFFQERREVFCFEIKKERA